MSACDAEMCPYWSGLGCVCAAMGIDEDERAQAKKDLYNWLAAEG